MEDTTTLSRRPGERCKLPSDPLESPMPGATLDGGGPLVVQESRGDQTQPVRVFIVVD